MFAATSIHRQAVLLLALIATAAFAGEPLGAGTIFQAPNVVPLSPRLVTSGQPTADALSRLATQGFGAVIYLAPLTVPTAVAGEADIVRGQGLEFVNIPIKSGKPTEADFRAFIAAMKKFRDRKVLVHCQANLRASSMTFLYRVIVDHENPETAYESVTQVWSPEGSWKRLITTQLKKAGIIFDPY